MNLFSLSAMISSEIARLSHVYSPQQVYKLAQKYSSMSDLISQSHTLPESVQAHIAQIPQTVQEPYCTYKDEEWPDILNHLNPRPVCLFYKGTLSLLQFSKTLGIIGSRTLTHYGRTVLSQLLEPLDFRTVPIVSGLAYGFDLIAHQFALKNNYPTIAVIGGGISPAKMYPKEHWRYVEEILHQGGLIVSEYPENTSPKPYHFPLRNRLIAALSTMLFVVQGGLQSGTLITAELALQIGRDVATLPAKLDEPLFAGNIKLLSQGAHLITSSDDLKQLLGIRNTESVQSSPHSNLSAQIALHPSTAEELSTLLHIPFHQILEQLTLLEIEGKVRQEKGLWMSP